MFRVDKLCGVKRNDLLRRLAAIARQRGEALTLVEGGHHTKARIGATLLIVPRHKDINEIAAKSIIRKAEENR